MAYNTNNLSIGDIRKKFHEVHELISTSYHESGHTIYGLLHLIKIDCVYVFANKRNKRIEGFARYNNPDLCQFTDNELFNDRLHAEIGIYYAGVTAEKRLFILNSGSDKFPMFLRDGSSHDINRAAKLFQKYNLAEAGRKRYAYKQKLIKEVDRELHEHWDAVTLVAHALFKKKKLSYPELQKLLTTKSKNKQFWKQQFKAINYFYENAEHLDQNDFKSILGL